MLCHPWCVGESGAAGEGWYVWSGCVALDEQIVELWRGIPMDAYMSQNGNFVFRPKGDGQLLVCVEEWFGPVESAFPEE